MPGSKEPTFFARLPQAGGEGVVVLEEGQMEEGAGFIVVCQVIGVEAKAAQDTGAGDVSDLILLLYFLLHKV